MNLIYNRQINIMPHVLISIAAFVLFVFLGTRIPVDSSTNTVSQLADMAAQLTGLGSVPLTLIIFLNNAFKCLLIIILGIILGIPPLFYLSVNAGLIGILIVNWPDSAYGTLIAGLLPHGIIEIPVLIISAALGLSIGQEVVKFITRQSSAVKQQLSGSLRFYYKWLLIPLAIAAIIEVFITPGVIEMAGGVEQVIIP